MGVWAVNRPISDCPAFDWNKSVDNVQLPIVDDSIECRLSLLVISITFKSVFHSLSLHCLVSNYWKHFNKIISNVEQLYQLTVVKFKECLLEAEFCSVLL